MTQTEAMTYDAPAAHRAAIQSIIGAWFAHGLQRFDSMNRTNRNRELLAYAKAHPAAAAYIQRVIANLRGQL